MSDNTTRQYLTVAVVLIVAGFVTGFSIGAPLFTIGVALLALTPVRRHRILVWPVLAAITGFYVGYVLFAPLYCGSAATVGESATTTTCTSILGGSTSVTGPLPADPPRDRAVANSVILALAAAAGALIAARRAAPVSPRGQ